MIDLFDATCAANGARTALVDGTVRISFSEWHRRSDCLAAALAERGVGRGDVIAFQLPNWWETAVVFTAIARLGAIANPLLPIFRERELSFMLRQSGARHLFIPHRYRDTDYPALAAAVRERGAPLEHVHALRGPAGDLLAESARATPPAATLAGDGAGDRDLLLLMYTSGTTADPKGVLHTNATLVAEVESLRRAHSLTTADSTLMPSPLTHISGVLHGILSPAILGTSAILMDRWDAVAAARLIAAERVTYMVGAPVFLRDLLAVDASQAPPSWNRSLRLFSCGGASVAPELMRAARRSLGCVAKRVYGSTEFPTISTTPPGDTSERGIETEGLPIAPNEVRIAGADGRMVGAGQRGEIQARGPECFVGYVDSRLNDDCFTADGWFRTGDLGELDRDGYLTVTGRLKEIVIRKGEKISIREVEDVLLSHPRIAAVCLVGIADPDVGERLCAAIQLAPTAANEAMDAAKVLTFLRQQGLAAQKLPERIAFLDSLPRTESGKAHRVAVAAIFERHQGEGGSATEKS